MYNETPALLFLQKLAIRVLLRISPPKCDVIVFFGTRISCKKKFRKENFQTRFVVAGCGFLSTN